MDTRNSVTLAIIIALFILSISVIILKLERLLHKIQNTQNVRILSSRKEGVSFICKRLSIVK